jgi:hypothetical protein
MEVEPRGCTGVFVFEEDVNCFAVWVGGHLGRADYLFLAFVGQEDFVEGK